ncbi:PREDICTED: dystrophin-like, partial [Thamnophis sirtalis]|uniref:Dystrophin-like n=1 Tax=Thamnophis sirtalis TaxID=35019 RepID=A0A6I9Y480_9SAUR
MANKHILVLTDNTATKAYINRQGGTHSRSLMQEAEQLGLWAERHLLSIRAEHNSEMANRVIRKMLEEEEKVKLYWPKQPWFVDLVAFLVAITSAKRVSELTALLVRQDFCVFHSDRMVLRLDPSFIPKVSKDLPEKEKEIECMLNNLNQFEQQLSQLRLWLTPIKDQLVLYNQVDQPRTFDIKEIEATVKSKQPDVEGILSKGYHLYKEKLATQPVTKKLEDLNTDWKTVNCLIQSLKEKPKSALPVVPLGDETLVSKETTISKQEMPSSLLLEVPALADFNKAWADLNDWLSLLDRVIQSHIVNVSDLDEINDMIIKQKATLQDLEQRHPQLEELITAAQNLKNKTSNQEVRTIITDQIEKIQNQWDE